MMRLGRKASLLVALYLLASAATAHAECAWVLWSQTVATGGAGLKEHWGVEAAHEKPGDCEKAARAESERIKQGRAGELEEMKKSGTTAVRVKAVCLPDTVDPRGEKAK